MAAHILPPQAAPNPAQLAQPGVTKLWKAAQDFEAVALGEFLAPIFDTVDNARSPFGGGDGEAAWRPVLTQELAKQAAGHGGLGLAVPIFQQMLRMQEAGNTETAQWRPMN